MSNGRSGSVRRGLRDTLLKRMQMPKMRAGMEAAFNATPEELGKAALKHAQTMLRGKRAKSHLA